MPGKTRKSSDSSSKTIFQFFKDFFSSIRSFVFAYLYYNVVDKYIERIVPLKQELFRDIDSVIPSDKKNGQIKILEIGVGPGKVWIDMVVDDAC